VAETILCGVDGSSESRAVLAVAADVARRLRCPLVVAHVADHAPVMAASLAPYGMRLGYGRAGSTATMQSIEEAQVEASGRLLDELASEIGLHDVELRVRVGLPAERLAELADEEDAAMIVVGSRGRGAFKAAFLGSVSMSLVGLARCPVLIVPPGAVEEAR
jgi:nucleotide-binding universal stress UspA family protein